MLIWTTQACDSDLRTDNDPNPQNQDAPAPATPTDTTDPSASFSIDLGNESVAILEGGGAVDVPVTITRTVSSAQTITLSASASASDAHGLKAQFTDSTLVAGEEQSTMRVSLDITMLPILPQSRVLTVSATNSAALTMEAQLTLQITPTEQPDVYLLIGQSNMVGISEPESKQANIGGPDALDSRILQLNVTGNDSSNFTNAADFTNPSRLFNNSQALTPALDPLHDGFEGDNGKSGDRIGLGLTFAKSALANTTTNIYLVPAAWSDTGFCKRDSNLVPGIGWNATQKTNEALSGTLLYDRAVARTNAALQQTGGILRGILWHQGEADSDTPACAEVYAANLAELVQALRTNIIPDLRGTSARAADAEVPFIAGTMAKGGSQAPFSESKQLVDTAHRTIGSSVAHADFVNADDLVPPAFACGGGSCIHFGADAYRELGQRYYARLQAIAAAAAAN